MHCQLVEQGHHLLRQAPDGDWTSPLLLSAGEGPARVSDRSSPAAATGGVVYSGWIHGGFTPHQPPPSPPNQPALLLLLPLAASFSSPAPRHRHAASASRICSAPRCRRRPSPGPPPRATAPARGSPARRRGGRSAAELPCSITRGRAPHGISMIVNNLPVGPRLVNSVWVGLPEAEHFNLRADIRNHAHLAFPFPVVFCRGRSCCTGVRPRRWPSHPGEPAPPTRTSPCPANAPGPPAGRTSSPRTPPPGGAPAPRGNTCCPPQQSCPRRTRASPPGPVRAARGGAPSALSAARRVRHADAGVRCVGLGWVKKREILAPYRG